MALTVSCSKVLMVPPKGQVAGMTVGAAVGAAVGAEGADVGVPAGAAVGNEGAAVGVPAGAAVGTAAGVPAGAAVGAAVGTPLGAAVGPVVPSGVGAKVGARVGAVGDVGVTGPVDRHTLSMANCRWHSMSHRCATASLPPTTWPQQLGNTHHWCQSQSWLGAQSTGCNDWQTSKHSELTCLVKCQSGKERAGLQHACRPQTVSGGGGDRSTATRNCAASHMPQGVLSQVYELSAHEGPPGRCRRRGWSRRRRCQSRRTGTRYWWGPRPW